MKAHHEKKAAHHKKMAEHHTAIAKQHEEMSAHHAKMADESENDPEDSHTSLDAESGESGDVPATRPGRGMF